MKKILALMLFIAMLCLLCACSSGDKTSNSDGSTGSNSNSSTSTDSNNTNTPNISPEESVNILFIDPFYGDLARFKADTGYGYMDKTGKIVIQPIYLYAQSEFDEELAWVKKDDGTVFIDKTGKEIFKVDFPYEKIGDFQNGAFWIETQEEKISGNVHTITYYDHNGTKLCSVEDVKNAANLTNFNEKGFALVEVGEYLNIIHWYKLVNKNGFVSLDGSDNYYITSLDGNHAQISGSMSLGSRLVYIDFETLNTYSYDSSNRTYYYVGADYYVLGSAMICKKSGISDETYLNILDIPSLSTAHEIVNVTYSEIDGKEYFNVYIKNANGIYFSAVIDFEGNVIIEPTKKYELNYSTFTSNGLCKAKDTATGLYGFIDMNGNWAIQPQYVSATDFSGGENSIAVVDGKVMINDKGEVICAFGGETNEVLSSLLGTYRYDPGYGFSYTLVFHADGTLKVKEYLAGYTTYTGQYVVKGSEIVLYGFGSSALLKNGTYPLIMDENSITFNSLTYTLVQS